MFKFLTFVVMGGQISSAESLHSGDLSKNRPFLRRLATTRQSQILQQQHLEQQNSLKRAESIRQHEQSEANNAIHVNNRNQMAQLDNRNNAIHLNERNSLILLEPTRNRANIFRLRKPRDPNRPNKYRLNPLATEFKPSKELQELNKLNRSKLDDDAFKAGVIEHGPAVNETRIFPKDTDTFQDKIDRMIARDRANRAEIAEAERLAEEMRRQEIEASKRRKQERELEANIREEKRRMREKLMMEYKDNKARENYKAGQIGEKLFQSSGPQRDIVAEALAELSRMDDVMKGLLEVQKVEDNQLINIEVKNAELIAESARNRMANEEMKMRAWNQENGAFNAEYLDPEVMNYVKSFAKSQDIKWELDEHGFIRVLSKDHQLSGIARGEEEVQVRLQQQERMNRFIAERNEALEAERNSAFARREAHDAKQLQIKLEKKLERELILAEASREAKTMADMILPDLMNYTPAQWAALSVFDPSAKFYEMAIKERKRKEVEAALYGPMPEYNPLEFRTRRVFREKQQKNTPKTRNP